MLCVRWFGACLGALVLEAPPCAADSPFVDEPPLNPYTYAWSDARMASRIGIGLALGGGVTGFTAGALRDIISKSVGGAWTVRASIGTHIPLGVELTYFGSAAKLELPVTETFAGVLIGT